MERKTDPARMLKAGIFTENPLLIEVTGLAPVLAGVSTVYEGVLLAAVSTLQLMIVSWLTALALKRLPASVRMLCYFVIAAPITAGALWFGGAMFRNEAASIYTVLPLTAVSSLTALHCERHMTDAGGGEGALRAFSSALGYTFAVLLISAVRELTVYGTLAGLRISGLAAPAAKLPFFGLLLMGFLAAAINGTFRNDLLFGGAEKNFMAHSVLLRYRQAPTAQDGSGEETPAAEAAVGSVPAAGE